MTVMYDKVSKALARTRESLHSACHQLGVIAENLDPKLLTVTSCDNCGYWDIPKNMLEEPDGTLYCKACVEIDYFRY